MKITHNKVGQNLNLTDAGKTDKAGKSGKSKESSEPKSILDTKTADPSAATKVDVSPRAQQMKKIKEAAMAAPDVDEAKVAKFQKLVDSGKYKVDAEAVADKMVDDHMLYN